MDIRLFDEAWTIIRLYGNARMKCEKEKEKEGENFMLWVKSCFSWILPLVLSSRQ